MVVPVTKKKSMNATYWLIFLKLGLQFIEYLAVFWKHFCLNLFSIQYINKKQYRISKNALYESPLYAFYTVTEQY